jgi:hypothetical protein
MVETDSKSLSADQIVLLQRTFLWGRINRRTPQVSDVSLESDGRRRGRVVKEAVAAGLIRDVGRDAWQGNAYEVMPDIMQTLTPQLPELITSWSSLYERYSHKNAYARPWIRLEELTIAEQFGAIKSEAVDWFIVATVPYEYHASFADDAETVLTNAPPASAYQRYFAGPFRSLDEAVTAKTGKPSVCLALSSPELRQFVADKFAEEKLQRTFAANLLWGLVTMEIVPKDLLFGPDDKPTMDSQLVEGHSLRLSSDMNPPSCRAEVRWDANLAESVERIKSRIERLQVKLEQLRAIDKNVAKFGGWDRFKEALESRLRSSLH